MARVKHAAYCGTRNVYGDMETAAKSLIANSDVGRVHFLIEDATFPRELPDIVECHDVSGQAWFPEDGPNYSHGWTWMTLMRAVLCYVLPDVDAVLSLDTDTIAVRDCSVAWDVPLDGCYFAATHEKWADCRPGLMYCNMGVALHNLAQLRDGKADEIIDALNRQRMGWPDQDAMSYLCQGFIAPMPPEYNACPWTDDTHEPDRIVHYAARDDWRDEPTVAKYRDMTWDEAMRLHGSHL